MVDWTASMRQTFEYYIVDPNTWKDTRRLTSVIESGISRDLEAETLGSASITTTEWLGECYIRIYLIVIQNGVKTKHPLGTYMIQTPSYSFDGKVKNITLDGYTPLIELKEKYPPLGYSLLKNDNIVDRAYSAMKEQMRAPVVAGKKSDTLANHFVADLNDTWMSFLSDLLANAEMKIQLDELGRVIFTPMQDNSALQPVWTFNADNSSILYPDFDIEHDLYGIPNEVEVIYSTASRSSSIIVTNDNPNSQVSTVCRGRRITKRITNPDLAGKPTEEQVREYATNLLRTLSSIEYTISFSHGYCPVRIGDCIRLNYPSAGLVNVKARVISQSIKCVPGCPVTTKAIFTNNLWEGV